MLARALQAGAISTLLAHGVETHHFAATPDGEECSTVFDWAVKHTRRHNVSPSAALVKERWPSWHGESSSDPLEALVESFLANVKRRYFAAKVRELAVAGDDPAQWGKLDELMIDAGRDLVGLVSTSRAAKLSEMRQRIDTYNAEKASGRPPGFDMGIPAFDAMTGGFRPGNVIVLSGYTNMGKALALDTPVPTPNGWTTMGAVEQGDMVFGADGKPTRVAQVWPVLLDRKCYEVAFNDGSTVIADAGHLWFTYRRNARGSEQRAFRKVGQRVGPGYDQSHKRAMPEVLTTEQIADEIENGETHSIPCAAPLERPEQDLPIDPYLFGYWLGDGSSASSAVTVGEEDVADFLIHLMRSDLNFRVTKSGDSAYLVWFGQRDTCPRGHDLDRRYSNGVCRDCAKLANYCSYRGLKLNEEFPPTVITMHERLRDLGVRNNKHIPAVYLEGSIDQRLALLQGLVDSDGHIDRDGRVEIAVTNRRLAEGALDIALSLGIRANIKERAAKLYGREVSRCWRVGFTTILPVARLQRKARRLRMVATSKTTHRMITGIREVPSVPVRCIAVEASDHQFLVGRSLIPTHNSLLANWITLNIVDQNHSALFLSLEMSRQEIFERIDTMIVNFSHMLLRNRELSDEDMEKWRRIATQFQALEHDLTVLDGLVGFTVDKLYAEISRHKPHFTVVDYVQLMKRPNARSSHWEGLVEITNECKELALSTESTILLVSQDNREAAQGGSTMATMGGSISIGQVADIYLGLHQDENMRAQKRMTVRLLKVRNGARDKEADLDWDPSHMRFGPPQQGADAFVKDAPRDAA